VRQISEKVPQLSTPSVQEFDSNDLRNSPRFPDLNLQHKFSFAASHEDESSASFRRLDQNSHTFGFGASNIENEEES